MIITEDGPASPLKTPTTSQGPSGVSDDVSSYIQPPPSYYGSMSDPMLSSGPSAPLSTGSSAPWSPPPPPQQPRHLSPEQLPIYYTPAHEQNTPKPGDYSRRAAVRFLRSFGVALLVLALLSILIDSLAVLGRSRRRGWQDPVILPGIDLEACSGIEWKTVERNTLSSVHDDLFANAHAALKATAGEYATSGDAYAYEATGSLDIPLTDETFMLLSQGSHQSGRLHVTAHRKPDDRRAYAIVIVKYTSAAALAQTHLCKLSSKGVQGFGIHTPESFPRLNRPEVFVDVKLALPAGYASKLAGFQTILPKYSQYVADMGEGVRFQHISLNSTLGSIHAETLVSDTLIVGTTNAPITGVYNTTSDVRLVTSNAPIDVELGLTYPDRASGATSAVLQSSNDYVAARTHLRSAHKSPRYSVAAASTNQHIELSFPTSPLDALLDATAHTSNAPAQIAVHPAWEGDFALRTSNARAVVDEAGVRDPTGRGRERTVWLDKAAGGRFLEGESRGTVAWGDRRTRTGSAVEIVSSNGRVTLVV
ncbi:hypothetical protein HDZ31DRAFT_33694 [Schizophyllum fasciatum]